MPEYTHVYSGAYRFSEAGQKFYARITSKTKGRLTGCLLRLDYKNIRNSQEIEFSATGKDNIKYFFENAKNILNPAEIVIPVRQDDPWYLDFRTHVYIERPMDRRIQNPAGEIFGTEIEGVHFTFRNTYDRNTFRQVEWYRAAYEQLRNTQVIVGGSVEEAPAELDPREIERQRIADVTRRANERAMLQRMRTPNLAGGRRR